MSQTAWLEALLQRDARSAYLRGFGSPTDLRSFRERVPVTGYDALQPWLDRVADGAPDVLFRGRPVAYECTGGSAGGAKLIPYTAAGLQDFEAALSPWLAGLVARHGITGRVYLALSPATRMELQILDVPLGVPDDAYLGAAWGAWIALRSAVPLDLGREPDMDRWRARTVAALSAARDLELISIWSPTFLLRLLDHLPDPRMLWPRLKLVSCWMSAASREPAAELQARLPHARFQAKGLMSTEGIVTVPRPDDDRSALTPHGFHEFEDSQGGVLLPADLTVGRSYQVILTTASGLFRYRTGDRVRCTGFVDDQTPVLEFLGRAGIVSDLVGEKLVEDFVQEALDGVRGGAFLTVQPARDGYAVVTEHGVPVDLATIESRLMRNPQYAYARQLNQLRPLAHRPVAGLFDRFVRFRLAQGTRLADIKPVALIADAGWLA